MRTIKEILNDTSKERKMTRKLRYQRHLSDPIVFHRISLEKNGESDLVSSPTWVDFVESIYIERGEIQMKDPLYLLRRTQTRSLYHLKLRQVPKHP